MMRFRVFERQDTALAVGLIAATILVFQQPLHYFWDFIQDIESRYHLDLLPGLTVLLGVFIFHGYRKRQDTRTHAIAAAAEAEQAHARAEELERLMALGNALGNALDRSALLQVLWRHVPAFAQDREFWAMIKAGDGWLPLVQGASSFNSRPIEVLQSIADRALSAQATIEKTGEGFSDAEDVCFPLIAADTVVGVLGIRARPALPSEVRRTLGAAAAVIAIGVRNVQLYLDACELSLRDGLTGCFNRGHALQALDSELRRSKRSGHPLSIVMFDLDSFKTVNDQLGHVRGDDLLRQVGALLPRVTRSSDVRCRYGGDEFLIILPDTPLIGAAQVAESLRREITTLESGSGEERIAVTASLGVTAAISGETNVTNFIDRADAALYEAKRQGRNRFCVISGRSMPSERDSQALGSSA
jgi:diguanylate cyclase (GGDEF)-like protein